MFIRKQTRLKGYNYANAGYYFITIKAYNSISYFGSIINNKMAKSKAGIIAESEWIDIPNHYKNIDIDTYIIMPDHVHGIIIIKDVADRFACLTLNVDTISNIIGNYKAGISRKIRYSINKDFKWQKSFYDRVIRNEKELINIREYITTNVESKLLKK